ncbi:type III secretion system outer membrane ring subunit SctC [Cupriavidus gilardii]|uniref:type III secretion system outer membrane ring subunit SctC n=1 Tax=Cupriavidus gilardii TaxID=82541 RepID=UPI001E5CE4B2|nr:type III secretion system outer membrane ring subunit SctC [Cupriavidus gilardii]MCT9124878.1 type III secretion system outer membrane ring subunit SctC [Cupriavidus gilardii]UXC38970.1 type III secretion system outer membrane ring subunit SctC [Cupriavidus gilardii]
MAGAMQGRPSTDKTLPPRYAGALRMMVAVALLLALWLGAAGPLHAADLNWPGKPFQISASEKRVADFLRELASTQGTTAVVDSRVDGTISGRFSDSPLSILRSVCASYGLTYYYDGSLLYIEPAGEARSEVIPFARGAGDRLNDALEHMQVIDSRYPITINDDDGTVMVSGPKRYVETVRSAVRAFDDRAVNDDRAEVQIFPLKYSWASDFRINRSGKDITVPGVVTVLRSLYGRQRAGAATTPVSMGPSRGASRMAELRSGGANNMTLPQANPRQVLESMNDGSTGIGQPGFGNWGFGGLPQFQADTRLNAVIVRDVPERMAQYQRLISSLDVKPRLIEIEVTIMDISQENLDSLGVDWRLHTRHVDLQLGGGGGSPLTFGNARSEGGTTGNTAGSGLQFTGAIGNDVTRYLLTRVKALAERGQANFVARPKVLTLDNTEAALENMREFYVRVDGFQDAGLFNVVAGTAVRVTPLVIDEREGRAVMLSIDIADGDLSGETVDNIPIVRRRSITTQAMVDEGKSLLIAGYTVEEKLRASSGVPFLQDVPIIGNLFKYQEKRQANMERFYLLTPRLVMPGMS